MARQWIAGAIKRPGALRAKARRAGAMVGKDGKISRGWMRKKAKAKGRTGKQARLAITLSSFGKRGR